MQNVASGSANSVFCGYKIENASSYLKIYTHISINRTFQWIKVFF